MSPWQNAEQQIRCQRCQTTDLGMDNVFIHIHLLIIVGQQKHNINLAVAVTNREWALGSALTFNNILSDRSDLALIPV